MHAISLWQPWASALFAKMPSPLELVPLKIDETRHWPAPARLIGQRIAIHAAKRRTGDELCFWEDLGVVDMKAMAEIGINSFEQLPRGCLIGTAILERCVSTNEYQPEYGSENHFWGNFSSDRFAWRFTGHERLETPIPCMGRQGFFQVEL